MTHVLTNKKVVITGASSGIGERIAWHVAKKGGLPILLARRGERLNELIDSIEKSTGVRGYAASCDLAKRSDIERAFSMIKERFGVVDALINNAGFGIFESVEETSIEQYEAMFQVNVFGLIQCVKVVLPDFVAQGGHIVNIASQAGKMSTPKASGYAASKHAVLGFTNALRLEVKPKGVYVTGVNLGPVRTNFFDQADPDGAYQKSVERFMLDPDVVAQKVIKHLFTSKREINLPSWMEAGSKLYQLMPGLTEKVMRKQFEKK
ncbi:MULTISPECIES: SDR family NAD(P)-dependent oxidoreductase [Pontibacillus]|uniref:SDR family oxidoreductase n=1 Tax=Pontibacillus chungwhensis TaxID=265426 RepID=A0ABY8UXV2_9BACI|nr:MULTISPECIES: SDR family oxidoreductase [Pontibacillus]MCD5323085.1 SDR family oxidoreductase [Pontibacillus sp. HN14]WIF96476.1 SDR family oxidoreductase [Pontibacillus chungwhensis]